MFRLIFKRNDSVENEETFIDAAAYETLTKETYKKITEDAAYWITGRYLKGEKWTVEIVQVVAKLERTGGSDDDEKKA